MVERDCSALYRAVRDASRFASASFSSSLITTGRVNPRTTALPSMFLYNIAVRKALVKGE